MHGSGEGQGILSTDSSEGSSKKEEAEGEGER